MANFEGYERRIAKIEASMAENGIESLDRARQLCLDNGIDVEKIVKGVQPIAFDNAVWAYTYGVALALKKQANLQRTQRLLSAKAWRHFAFRVPLPTKDR